MFWLAVSSAVLAAVAVVWLRRRVKLHQARRWPIGEGRVDSTVIRLERQSTYQSVFVAEVMYSYAVQGATYSGRLRRTFLLIGRAEKWTGNYASGRSLNIRYNPGKVRDSVVFEREQAGTGAG